MGVRRARSGVAPPAQLFGEVLEEDGMSRRFIAGMGPVAGALLLVACAASPTAAGPRAAPAANLPPAAAAEQPAAAPAAPATVLPPLQTVKVSVFPSMGQAPTFIGEKRGYFAEEGIEIEEVPYDTSSQIIPSLSVGQLDIATGGTAAGFFNAIAQGINVRITLDQTSAPPGTRHHGVLVRRELIDSGRVREPADLRGLRLGFTSKGHSTEMLLDTVLGWGGLTFQDVETAELPYPEMNIALANNNLDVSASIDPNLELAVQGGYGVRWKSWSEVLPNDEVGVVMYSPQFADGRAAAAKRMTKAWLRGVRDYETARTKGTDREDIIAIFQEHNVLRDRGLYDVVPWSAINPNGRPNAAAIAAAQDWFAAHGYVPRKIDLSQVIDNQFADYAVAQLGPYQP
jgi:NitT/TauT family transport system substrate-binding protein